MAKGNKWDAINDLLHEIPSGEKQPPEVKTQQKNENQETKVSEPVVSMPKSEHEKLVTEITQNAESKIGLDSKKKGRASKKEESTSVTMIKVHSTYYLDILLKCKKKGVYNIQVNSFLYELMEKCPPFLQEVIKGCQDGSIENLKEIFTTAKKENNGNNKNND